MPKPPGYSGPGGPRQLHALVDVAVAVAEAERVVAGSLANALLESPRVNRAQGAEARPHHRQPRSERTQLLVDLDEIDVDPALAEDGRGGESGRAAADDEDVADGRHQCACPWAQGFASAGSGACVSAGGKASSIESGMCRFRYIVFEPCDGTHLTGCQSGT